ncbi:methenyltetrahydromethanopterin cyclohydrolase [Aeoliella mucimassa]|nr:methenyltetrahydromethanopterin cyclohydrolase [Aeoliella mucimassa]
MANLQLNHRAWVLCESLVDQAVDLRIHVWQSDDRRIFDLGVQAPGGLEAGRRMAGIAMSGLGEVSLAIDPRTGGPAVVVRTDQPVAACMASQYAGWAIAGDEFFAMGSGPMRASAAREDLFDQIGYHEQSDVAVGLLESDTLPPSDVCHDIASKCGVDPKHLSLLVAPTNSQAGNLQVVARSVETALHKLHELNFDISRIKSGWGSAPLPPVAKNSLAGIGRTNDAILYGGHVVLYVRGDQASIDSIGPKTPSNSSKDHGRPFAELFAEYDNDFYKIDSHLFSPGVVEFVNLDTGVARRFGEYAPDVLDKSFTH